MGPLRAGLIYGIVGVVVAVVANLHFLVLDPGAIDGWILAVIEDFRTNLALAAYVLLAILAALRVRPTHAEPDVPYRSLLFRDGALAATIVAVIVGVGLFVIVALQATVFAETQRSYAEQSAPQIVAYLQELAERFNSDPPDANAQQVEQTLRPPTLNDLGLSLFNTVLRALLLGTVGAAVGLLRGRFGTGNNPEKSDAGPAEPAGP